ncbi:MAG TPA: cyclase family protein [Acidimicrobiia bacterium]|nr:cyclase family protein [Acidimicrobiia bacterium]
MSSRLVDLSHSFGHGEGAYPGLPEPVVRVHLSFEASANHYDDGTEFSIKGFEMIANTGTYLDTPSHRFRDGFDLAGLPLEAVADVPGIVIDAAGPAIDVDPGGVEGTAVLFRTGWSRHWGTGAYNHGGHPHLTRRTADALAAGGAIVVGIDSVNIDDTSDGTRPAHTILLDAEIPVVEHLTNLEALPDGGFRFFAVPPRFRGVGTFPVRAFAIVE